MPLIKSLCHSVSFSRSGRSIELQFDQDKADLLTTLDAEKRNAVNTVWRSKYRNLMKKTAAAMKAGDAETAKASYSLAVKMIQKTASKNIIHKNKSNRLVSRLTLKYNAFTRGEDFRQAKHFEISPRIVDTSVFAEQLKQYELCQASEACVADLDDIAVTTKLGQEQAAAAEAA